MEFLQNTDIVVAIGFFIFVGILLYYGVPKLIASRLDDRAVKIRKDLDDARAIREEAQALLAQYERKQKEVRALAEEIVEAARVESAKAAEAGKEDIRRSVERRLKTATDQIAAAEAAAVREIRDKAASVAVAAAAEVIRSRMSEADAEALVSRAIGEAGAKLH
jgi:F-type H+-transporting ATPase subunit b